MIRNSELSLAQEDGDLPSTIAFGRPAGESGIIIWRVQFRGGAHFSATPQQHLIWFQLSAKAAFNCRIAESRLRHEPTSGSLAICPAGVDSAAEAQGDVEAILVLIEPWRLALIAAENSAPRSQLIERFAGQDATLLNLAHSLASESATGYPNGPLFWNELACSFVDGVVACHMAYPAVREQMPLDNAVLAHIKEYVTAHLDEPIAVASLAKLAGLSPFHFSRVFRQSVGITPHRYVVHLRVQRAVELVRDKRASLAEIAARTGFADQSHLWRWVRRIYGVSLSRLLVQPRADSRNLHDRSLSSP